MPVGFVESGVAFGLISQRDVFDHVKGLTYLDNLCYTDFIRSRKYEQGSSMNIKYTTSRFSDYIGVWCDEKPRGRIRKDETGFRAFTNKAEPGKAYLGTFSTKDAAAEAVVKA